MATTSDTSACHHQDQRREKTYDRPPPTGSSPAPETPLRLYGRDEVATVYRR